MLLYFIPIQTKANDCDVYMGIFIYKSPQKELEKKQMKIYTKGKINKVIEATHIINRGSYYDIYYAEQHIEQLTHEEVFYIAG